MLQYLMLMLATAISDGANPTLHWWVAPHYRNSHHYKKKKLFVQVEAAVVYTAAATSYGTRYQVLVSVVLLVRSLRYIRVLVLHWYHIYQLTS